MDDEGTTSPARPFLASLRSARSAAIGGLVFAATLMLTLYLYRSGLPYLTLLQADIDPTDASIGRVRAALLLLPYCGIAFLWFMAALTYSFGYADNRLFTTVFLSSGILFVGLMFVAGAIGAAALTTLAVSGDVGQTSRVVTGTIVNELLMSYSARAAAVFSLSLSTFGRVRPLMPLWLSLSGTVAGLFLLLVPFGVRYVEFVFPAWVAALSIYLFVKDPGARARSADD